MVVARVVYPPKIFSMSQTAMRNGTHIEHIVAYRLPPKDPEDLPPPDPRWPRWHAEYKTLCGNFIDGSPVTFRPARPCARCMKAIGNLERVEANTSVLLSVDAEEWMELVLARAKHYKVPKLPSVEDALDRYFLPL